MNLESLRRNKVGVAVGVVVLLAVAGGAYLAFADQDPVKISNAEELQNMNNNLDADYVLVDDIDASEIENFEPIGSRSEPFTGTFDGAGHTISGLAIARDSSNFVGLFGVIAADGEVRDVTLAAVSVDGGSETGSLAGESAGVVTGVTVSGSVPGANQVGGLVGSVGPNGTVSASSATGTVAIPRPYTSAPKT